MSLLSRGLVPYAVVALAPAVVAVLLAPRPPMVSDEAHGDGALAERTHELLEDRTGYDGIAVAQVADGEIRTVGLGGVGPDTPFEIGSIAKALTGMLLADLAGDGIVELREPVSALLPNTSFADPQVAATTLEELATHHSGLPRDVDGYLLSRSRQAFGAEPFPGLGPADLVQAAARASAGDTRGTLAYSNLGMALLGQALAARTETPYPQLLRERVLDPLGMDDTAFHPPDVPLPEGAGPGSSPGGTAMSPWRELLRVCG